MSVETSAATLPLKVSSQPPCSGPGGGHLGKSGARGQGTPFGSRAPQD